VAVALAQEALETIVRIGNEASHGLLGMQLGAMQDLRPWVNVLAFATAWGSMIACYVLIQQPYRRQKAQAV
jgi:hypothetical protein